MKISHIQQVISEPENAREYIKEFMHSLGKEHKTGFVDTNERRINFSDMTDEDAVFVANQFQTWTAEAAKNRGLK